MKQQHGGARPGAGRPASEIKRRDRSIRLSDDEFEKVKLMIIEMRKPIEFKTPGKYIFNFDKQNK